MAKNVSNLGGCYFERLFRAVIPSNYITSVCDF